MKRYKSDCIASGSRVDEAIFALLQRYPDKDLTIRRSAFLSVEPTLEKYLAFTEEERATLRQFADDKFKPTWVTSRKIPDVTYYHAGGAPRYIFRAMRPDTMVIVAVTLSQSEDLEKSFAIIDVSKLDSFILANLAPPYTDEVIKVGEEKVKAVER